MYWRLGSDTSSGTYDRAASIWFAALCVIFQSGNNACTIFYSQKPLLRREISSGLYHYSAFYIAKGLTSLPFQLVYSVIFNTTVYFLVPASRTAPAYCLTSESLLPMWPLSLFALQASASSIHMQSHARMQLICSKAERWGETYCLL